MLFLVLGLVIIAGVSYFLGSVNVALILSRKVKGDDVREHGSGNAGTTNMLRTFGWRAGAMTFLGEILKGVIAVIIGRTVLSYMGYEAYAVYGGYLGGISSLIGQMFPIYFGFKGGKGVAAALGAVCALNPVLFLILCAAGFSLAAITGYVSAGSVTGAAIYPVLVLVKMLLSGTFNILELVLAIILGGLLLISHRENIKRLLNGTENKLSPSKKEKK